MKGHKKPILPAGFNRALAYRKVAAVIEELAPGNDALRDGTILVFRWLQPGGDFELFAIETEKKRLRELRKKAEDLKLIWENIDQDLRSALIHAAGFERHQSRCGLLLSERKHEILQFLDHGVDILNAVTTDLLARLDDSKPIGKRNYASVRLFAACKEVLERRLGQQNMSASNKLLTEFAERVFDALGISDSVEATAKSWHTLEN